MENTLSVKEYISQRQNNSFCEQVARVLCAATKRAWDSGNFSATKVTPITSFNPNNMQARANQQDSEYCKGTRIDFKLATDKITTEYDKGYGTIEHITQNGKYDSLNVEEIHKAVLLNNQDWNLITKFYFKHLHEYLDLSGVYLLSRHITRARFDKYVSYGSSDKDKFVANESVLAMPDSVDGEATIPLYLLIVSNNDFNKFIKSTTVDDEDSQD